MDRIRVHGMLLRPDEGPPSVFTPYYPIGCLVAYAKVHGEGMLREAFQFEPITPVMPQVALEAVQGGGRDVPRVVLLSNYIWNQRVNLEFARELKRTCPDSLIVVGGPHVPRHAAACERYLRQNDQVDIAVRHEGEVTLAEILETIARARPDSPDLRRLDFSAVQGVTYLGRDGSLVRTEDRSRARDLASFPSPYTTGEFDHWLPDGHYMLVETNRGCPYGCTFCDWGAATLSKIHTMSMERVLGDIEYVARNRGTLLGICDANFGILPRDIDIARHIVAMRERYGYPTRLGYSNAKTTNPRLTEIFKLLWDAGLLAAGQISMQTTDSGVLEIAKRSNIKTSEYEKMIRFLHENDVPVASDMMIGLPGQNYEVCKKDLQFFFDHKVTAVIFATSVMPNAPMAEDEYRAQYQIELDPEGVIESTMSFDREEYARMFELCLVYKIFIKQGLARYLLYFLQVEHGIKAMDLLSAWKDKGIGDPKSYPFMHAVRTLLYDSKYPGGLKHWLVLNWSDERGAVIFENLVGLYREMLAFCSRELGKHVAGSDVDTILTAQLAVMPQKGDQPAQEMVLAHDLVAYLAALRRFASVGAPQENLVRLRDYGPGKLVMPPQPPRDSYAFIDFDMEIGRVERESNLRI